MNKDSFIRFLSDNGIAYCENEDMRKNTSFKIGGCAPLVVYPRDSAQVSLTTRFASESGIPYFVLGRGSNLLVRDEGIDVVFIKTSLMDSLTLDGTRLTVGAGCPNHKAAVYALEHSLSGLEFAHGIPGSIGGACFMNAGAYGEDMSCRAISAEYVDTEGRLHTISGDALHFGYRSSVFKPGETICSVTMELTPSDAGTIRTRMNELISKRRSSQPLEYPSAGSIFKRPEGYYAGKLIQDCGLRGYRVGGAQVSEKHAGFIINTGGATCKDVLELIAHIQKTVFERFGVRLETEVKIV